MIAKAKVKFRADVLKERYTVLGGCLVEDVT